MVVVIIVTDKQSGCRYVESSNLKFVSLETHATQVVATEVVEVEVEADADADAEAAIEAEIAVSFIRPFIARALPICYSLTLARMWMWMRIGMRLLSRLRISNS